MLTRMIAMLVACALVFGGIFGFQAFKRHAIADAIANQVPPPVAVSAAPAEATQWTSQIPSIGFLEAVQGVNVSPSLPGLVVAILFQSGQSVKHGDVLVKLDSAVEEANLRSTQAQLPAAQSNYQRVLRLAAQGNAPQASLDQALAQLQSLQAQIASLQATIERRTITAPFDGVLGIRQIDLGQYLQPGTPIVNLQDLSVMRIRFIVPQRELARIAVGQDINIGVDAYPHRPFSGSIAAIEPVVNQQSGIVQVQAEVPNAGGLLRSGMFATVEVILPGTQTVVTVPDSAVSFTLYGDSVYVLTPAETGSDGQQIYRSNRVSVTTGERQGNRVVIVSGLKAGDLVVTAGQLKLQNGSRVVVDNSVALVPPATPPLQ